MPDDLLACRRSFLRGATATMIALAVPDAIAQEARSAGTFPDGTWLNQPHHWRREGSALIVTADRQTDFWRKTFYGYITDNGHLYYQRLDGEFTTILMGTDGFTLL
jgi:hypothetical protein